MRRLIIAGISAAALALSGVAFAANNGADQSALMKAQQKLHSEGLYKGKVDGRIGPETEAALKSFQKKNNLEQTGQLDEQTKTKLGLGNEESGTSTPPESSGSNGSMSGSHSGMPSSHSGATAPSNETAPQSK